MTPLLFLTLALAPAAPATDGAVLFITADTRGALERCGSCPRELSGGPGLAERAGWTAARRAEHEDLVLVDAGDFLVGPESLASGGRVVVEAFGAMGYEAVHVTLADLWIGRDAALAALAEAPFELISANLYGDDGARLFLPYHLTEVGDTRVALVGVSAPGVTGAGVDGVTARPVAECLREVAAQLDELGVARRVLFFHGAAAARATLPADLLASFELVIASGTAMTDPSTIGLPPSGQATAVVRFDAQAATVDVRPLPEDAPADADVAALVSAHLAPEDLWAEEPAPVPDAVDLTRVGAQEVWRKDRNRAMELIVLSAERADTLRGVSAPPGRTWLALEAEWENRLASELVTALDYPRAVHISSFARQAFLLVDGTIVVRPEVDRAEELGATARGVLLRERGAFAATRLVFPMPDVVPQSLELCVYPDRFAPLHVPVLENPGAADPEATAPPVVARAENDELEVEVRAVQRLESWAGRSAAPGRALWAIDLAATSWIVLGADALALDPTAAVDAVARLGEVFEYLHGYELATLVVDGTFHHPPLATSWVDREPVILPDRAACGRLVFEVPEDAVLTELLLPFTGLKFDGEAEERYPRSLVLPLGVPPEVQHELLQFEAAPIRAALLASAREDTRLDLRLSLTNFGPSAGFVEPRGRFALTVPGFAPVAAAAADEATPHPAPERIWLDPGRTYAFDLTFPISPGATSGTLTFHGVAADVAFPISWESGEVVPADPIATPEIHASSSVETAPEPQTAAPVERVPQGLAGVGLEPAAVNRAIERGAEFLWEHCVEELAGDLDAFGTEPEHWLAALALVHADYDDHNPAFAQALRGIWRHADGRLTSTYANAVLCLLVDALGDESLRPILERAVRHLVEAQGSDGSWSYSCYMPAAAKSRAAVPTIFVTVSRGEAGNLERKSPWPERALGGDNSVTQFALLGLRTAERWGLAVPDETWARAEVVYEQRFGEDGGWAYKTGRSYGSMTCAGICSLVVARWAQDEPLDLGEAHVAAGLGWMGENFSTSSNPGTQTHHYYYLYSLERVGRLLDVEFVGEHEWYPEGVRFLVGAQRGDGSWQERGELVPPTSFALLFLTRATESLVETVPAPTTGRLLTSVEAVEPPPVYFILDASGSMRSELDGRAKLDLARDALAEIARDLPPGTPVALRVYGHRLTAIDPGADEDTELVLPFESWSADHAVRFADALEGLRPRGKTPLAASLEAAVADLRGRRATVVLLTDGGEDTRARRDPIEAAAAYDGIEGLSLVVLGLDIGKERWTKQLTGMAAAANGSYLPVNAGAALKDTLRSALLSLPDEVELRDADGIVHDRFALPAERELPAGDYVLAFAVGPHSFEVAFAIEAGGTTRVHLHPGHFRPQEN